MIKCRISAGAVRFGKMVNKGYVIHKNMKRNRDEVSEIPRISFACIPIHLIYTAEIIVKKSDFP